MDYSLAQITSAADCDELLSMAASDKSDLDFRNLQQSRSYQTILQGTTSVEAELAAVISEIASMESVIASLPDGETKSEFESRVVKLRHKKFLLEERKERYGVLALLQKEFAISCIEKQQEEVNAYIVALNQRREEVA